MIAPEAGTQSERIDFNSRRLWSLWDIMEHFPASLFIKCISNIDRHYTTFAQVNLGTWAANKNISEKDGRNLRIYTPQSRNCVSD
jgi:hypothetical protein